MLIAEKQLDEVSRKYNELNTELNECSDEDLMKKLKSTEEENKKLNIKLKALESRHKVSVSNHQALLDRFEELEEAEKLKTDQLIEKQNAIEKLETRLDDLMYGDGQKPSRQSTSKICAIL